MKDREKHGKVLEIMEVQGAEEADGENDAKKRK